METETDQSTQEATTTQAGGQVRHAWRSSRSLSESLLRNDQSSGRQGKATSTPQESKSQLAKSGSARVEQTLKKAGAAQPSGSELGSILMHADAKGKKTVDYRYKAFPPPTLCIVQPGSGYLGAAPLQPRAEWTAETHATQADVMVHIKALHQGGSQHSKYRDHDHWLRD